MSDSKLIANLKALEDASFPKACTKCGKQFENEKAFVEQTKPFEKAPTPAESKNEKGMVFIKLARQCLCGQPILDHFGNRRDTSPKGELRRKAFSKVLDQLEKHGLPRAQARQELLNHMQNKPSPILQKLGIFNQ